jgi:pyrimidine 5'-nucleotidase
MAQLQPAEILLFDLDDTIYRNPRVGELMKDNIQRYMLNKLKVPKEGIEARGALWYNDYGTTMAGLRAQGYEIDYEDWHKDVHGALPYHDLVQEDPELRRLLLSLPQPKYIFTNGDIKHARTVLSIVGIADIFQDIICFESIMKAARDKGACGTSQPVVCKPSQEAFELGLEQVGAKPSQCLFFDDSTRNIQGAAACGIRGVLVGSLGKNTPALAEVESLHHLPEALPELWQHQATRKLDPSLYAQADIPTVSKEVQVSAN